MDELDRRIVNALQGGFPVVERPYAAAAASLGIDEAVLIARLEHLLADGTLSRFGPMFDAERLGGSFCLCAMKVPADRFDAVAAIVNALPAVAHNYERAHALNMWFVLATQRPEEIDQAVARIEEATGLTVHAMPKEAEYFIGLKLVA
ncbi:MAG: Lrp/AsnC family transcriptional regulator [Alphaproteobacteria bacterium]|nr:Lrp/AsnC family transcriptional regulator [Alphaproteobacteria bacterium]